MLYLEVLFEPFEKQLNLSPIAIKFCHFQCAQIKVIGQENKFTFVLFVPISYQSQWLGIISLWVVTSKLYRTI